MKLVEIEQEEYEKLLEARDTYFANGCAFDEATDNLIAFSWYKDATSEPYKFYKVTEE